MIDQAHAFAFGFYAVAAVLLGIALARSDRRLPGVATAVLALALATHAWGLGGFVARWGELPLVGLGPCLSSIGFLIALGALLAATVWNAGTLGLVLVPLAAVLVGGAAWAGVEPTGELVVFRGVWFALHVVFAFLGYAGLTVAFAAGLMYLLQFRELKSKHFGAIFRFFPPLDTLDRLGRRGLLIGFPFLSVALLLAWAWTKRFGVVGAARQTEVIWGVLTWFVLLAALVAGTGNGRRGHRAALASVLGFVIVVAAYLVLRVVASQGGDFL